MIQKFKKIYKIKTLSEVQVFRLLNLLLVSISFSLLSPLLINLQGFYLATWVIALFSIFKTLSVKTNKYFTSNYSISELYQIGILVHLVYTVNTGFYFYNKEYMIISDSIIGIIIVSVFSAYSISLNNYITEYKPKEMNEFQLKRNSINADGIVIGLVVSMILSYINQDYPVYVFLVFNLFFSLWMIKNWNFFKQIKEKAYGM